MTLPELRDKLLTVGVPVFHYFALEAAGNYIVWAEDGQADSLWADGKMKAQAISGSVDYFSKTEFDPNAAKIQAALDGLSWRLNSVQYEPATGYIHYEWTWEIENGGH